MSSKLAVVTMLALAAIMCTPALNAQYYDLENHPDHQDYWKPISDWTGGTWDDPTEDDPTRVIGKVILKNLNVQEAWNFNGNSTFWPNASEGNPKWAGDYYFAYVIPVGRSDLQGELYCLERLGESVGGVKFGSGNRNNERGWGVSGHANASVTNPASIGNTEELPSWYNPVTPPDETSEIKVTWKQAIEMRVEITHYAYDAEQTAFTWVRPIVQAINGDTVWIEAKISNGSVTTHTSGVTATAGLSADGIGAGIQTGTTVSHTGYSELRVHSIHTSSEYEKVITYSKANPNPGVNLRTSSHFEWVSRIDDNNNAFTWGSVADRSTFTYNGRISTDIKPSKIVLKVGTNTKLWDKDLPQFTTPSFRNFTNDQSPLTIFGNLIATMKSNVGATK